MAAPPSGAAAGVGAPATPTIAAPVTSPAIDRARQYLKDIAKVRFLAQGQFDVDVVMFVVTHPDVQTLTVRFGIRADPRKAVVTMFSVADSSTIEEVTVALSESVTRQVVNTLTDMWGVPGTKKPYALGPDDFEVDVAAVRAQWAATATTAD